MPNSIDKRTLLIALKEHLAAEIYRTRADLEIEDDSQKRIHLSDCMDNLRSLECVQDSEQAIFVIEMEESEFHLDRLTSTNRHLELVAKVPYPLSGVAAIQGREYRLARHTAWYENARPGMEFHGSPGRDERWRSQLIVRSKI